LSLWAKMEHVKNVLFECVKLSGQSHRQTDGLIMYVKKDRHRDVRTDGQMYGQTDRRTSRQTDL